MPKSVDAQARTRWSGVAPEDRKSERRSLLIDAAFELIGTEGAAGTTVRAVCQTARLNPRYFYESFADLDSLLVAVFDRTVEQMGEQVFAAVNAADKDPASQLRAAMRAFVGFVADDRRRGRVLYVEALGNERVNRRRVEMGHALVEFIERHAAATHGPLPEGERVGTIGAAILVGGISELLAGWLDGRIDVSQEQLAEDAAELFLAVSDTTGAVAARRARARRG